jgi:hypothetical protein
LAKEDVSSVAYKALMKDKTIQECLLTKKSLVLGEKQIHQQFQKHFQSSAPLKNRNPPPQTLPYPPAPMYYPPYDRPLMSVYDRPLMPAYNQPLMPVYDRPPLMPAYDDSFLETFHSYDHLATSNPSNHYQDPNALEYGNPEESSFDRAPPMNSYPPLPETYYRPPMEGISAHPMHYYPEVSDATRPPMNYPVGPVMNPFPPMNYYPRPPMNDPSFSMYRNASHSRPPNEHPYHGQEPIQDHKKYRHASRKERKNDRYNDRQYDHSNDLERSPKRMGQDVVRSPRKRTHSDSEYESGEIDEEFLEAENEPVKRRKQYSKDTFEKQSLTEPVKSVVNNPESEIQVSNIESQSSKYFTDLLSDLSKSDSSFGKPHFNIRKSLDDQYRAQLTFGSKTFISSKSFYKKEDAMEDAAKIGYQEMCKILAEKLEKNVE